MNYYDEIQRVTLVTKHYYQQHLIDLEIFGHGDVQSYLEELSNAVAIRFKCSVAKEILLDEDVKYPANWWEAFKERWLPTFCPKVKYVEYHVTAEALYPHLSLPENRPYIQVMKLPKARVYND